jgi:ribokinase
MTVVSLGSINVDRIQEVSAATLEDLMARYDWFPERGRTVETDDLPAGFGGDPDRVRHGGKGANQAVATARVGARATMLGKVGPDHGRFGVLDRLREAGVDVDRVGIADEPTGTAYVFVDPTGDNRIVVRPGANAAVDRAYVDDGRDAVLAADCLLLQNEIPADPVAALLAELAGVQERPTVVLDPAPPEGVSALLRSGAVDILTPNETEYETLRPHIEAFDGVVLRKRGGDDVVVEGDETFTITPPSVDPVDTTGAGDVLNGVLAARLVAGAPLRDAVETATVAASMSTREAGARRGVPTLEAIRAFRGAEGRE